MGSGLFDDGRWWLKVTIDIDHRLAWNVVQEPGPVLNYVSLDERLPTVFMPVSPPPYMNGARMIICPDASNPRKRTSHPRIVRNGWKAVCHER